MIEEIKKTRVKIDLLMRLIGEYCPKNGNGSRQLSLAFTQIESAKMQLGKVLQELDAPNPYPNSKRPFMYRTTQNLDSTHGIIPAGTTSIKEDGNNITFLLGETEVIFVIDEENKDVFEQIANTIIEPTADVVKEKPSIVDWGRMGRIQRVKFLRAEVSKISDSMKNFEEFFNCDKPVWAFRHYLRSVEFLIECNMSLGLELGRIHEEENK